MSKLAYAHIKCDDGVRSPMMARWESPQHERTTALDHSMELLADRTKIAPTGPPEVAGPLCAAHLRCAVRCAPLQEIAETVSRALEYLTDRLVWPYCSPLMAERLMMLHHEIELAHEAYMRCAWRSATNRILPDLHDRLTRLLGDSLLEHGYDDDDEYKDDNEDIWDDETTWGKGSTTTPTT